MRSDKIIYSLNTGDIQTVAKETLNRKLSDIEIEGILDSIAEKISWYDVIADVIIDKFRLPAEE